MPFLKSQDHGFSVVCIEVHIVRETSKNRSALEVQKCVYIRQA